MKILFASDSFKGTISSARTIELLTKAAHAVWSDCETCGILIADGGEGTVETVTAVRGGELVYVNVNGPLMEPVRAFYGTLSDTEAILEMASASGLPLIPEGKRDPRNTTTFGTGEVLKAILDAGFTDITIAIGGSATNDGGMGCAKALGMRFLDDEGKELEGYGKDLARVVHIDRTGMDPRMKNVKLTVMCDVVNPLCGENGATYTFGAQKGGTPKILDELEAGMRNYRDVIHKEYGIDPDQIVGGGAAGGLGAALNIFFKGELRSGIETVLDRIDFDSKLSGVDLVVTGEGRTDGQSAQGKVLQGVCERTRKYHVPVVALSGSLGDGYEKIYEHGIQSLMTTVDGPMSLEKALENAEDLYVKGAVRLFRMIQVGMMIADTK